MRIGFITPYYPPATVGGMEISLSLLADTLAQKGHQVFVFTLNYRGEDRMEGKNPRIYRLGWFADTVFLKTNPLAERLFVRKILSLRSDFKKLDLIDAYNWFHPAFILSKKLKIPYVVSVRDASCVCDFRIEERPQIYPFSRYFFGRLNHFGYFPRQIINAVYGFFLTQANLFTLKHASCIFCASFALQDLVKSLNSCTRVVKSIALTSFHKEPIEIDGVDFSRDKVVVYAGRLTQGKGANFLYDAAQKIQDQEIKFVFIGEGSLNKKSAQGQSNIFFLGRKDRNFVLNVLSKARVCAVPSLVFEAFPRLAIESIALGIPVVGTKVGGIPEAIGKAGILIESGNEEQLKVAILRMCKDEEFYRRKKLETKKEALKYNQDKIARDVISGYRMVINHG